MKIALSQVSDDNINLSKAKQKDNIGCVCVWGGIQGHSCPALEDWSVIVC